MKTADKKRSLTQYFCAIDWAKNKHYYVLKEGYGEVLSEGFFDNSPEGFEQFLQTLQGFRHGQPVHLVFEATKGAITYALLDVDWLKLCPINPVKTKRLNDLDGASKGKSDPRDSHLMVDYLRMNHERFKSCYVERDLTVRLLQQEVSLENALMKRVNKLKQRIWSEINAFCPILETMLLELERPAYHQYLLDFDPLNLASDEEIRAFLAKHKIRTAKSVENFIELHRQVKPICSNAVVAEMQRDHLRVWIELFVATLSQLRQSRQRVDTLFKDIPQAHIYLSMPGVGQRLAPRLASLFGANPQAAFESKKQVLAYFGQTPLTQKSGEHKNVLKRFNCSNFARDVCFLWARCINMHAEFHWPNTYLKKCKQRGDGQPTRYRKLGIKLLSILYRCLLDNAPYSEAIYARNLHPKM